MANSPTPNAEAASNNPKYSVGAGSTLDTAAGRITASSSGGVEYIRPELSNMFYQYQLVEDCVKGEEAVKQRGTAYLPHPDPKDTNATRYDNYKLRAVFYNATRRTLEGLVGQVFLRDPVVTLPTACKVIEKDADGSGVSLSQLAKKAEEYILEFGRCGLLVDYPDTQGRSTSRAELLSGTVRPTVGIYDPRDVRNWRTIVVKGRVLYSLIVLAEVYDQEDDGFEAKKEVQYRVLRLEANGSKYKYTVEVQRPKDAKYVAKKYEPRDGKGNNLEEIPFTFIGAKTNNSDVDAPPMFDLAAVNIAHYRNSADYEESVFLIGQPTPWASGLTESWVKDVLKGELRIGSRAVIPLPENGACGLLQAEANTLASEAMEKKERQMVALGAKLVEQKQVQRTATESNHDKAAETSVLSATAQNVEQAFKWGLEWCAIFTGEVGVNDDARQKIVDFKLNSEFDLTQLDATMLGAVVKAWQSGALMDEEMRDKMHEAGLADKKFEEWQTEQTDKMTTAVDQLAAETIAQQVP